MSKEEFKAKTAKSARPFMVIYGNDHKAELVGACWSTHKTQKLAEQQAASNSKLTGKSFVVIDSRI